MLSLFLIELFLQLVRPIWSVSEATRAPQTLASSSLMSKHLQTSSASRLVRAAQKTFTSTPWLYIPSHSILWFTRAHSMTTLQMLL